ncbi:hypothetical protein DSO57_1011090 [Entomophthora muscae]|uniref:Uncharacterized protein n=1 Tax=Entomophthora muscae TaxID=34485 RepID=A0ACC2SJE0_9FUNG|nr:hypothetical protein DSO57_1011090 [Entomophthora muscae]
MGLNWAYWAAKNSLPRPSQTHQGLGVAFGAQNRPHSYHQGRNGSCTWINFEKQKSRCRQISPSASPAWWLGAVNSHQPKEDYPFQIQEAWPKTSKKITKKAAKATKKTPELSPSPEEEPSEEEPTPSPSKSPTGHEFVHSQEDEEEAPPHIS